jgi:hypothetical protein
VKTPKDRKSIACERIFGKYRKALWVEEYRTKPGEGHSLKALYQYSTLSSS